MPVTRPAPRNRARDLLERLVWTVIAAAATNLGSVGVLGIAAWKGAAMAALNGVVTFVLVVARQHLAALPDPGDGLPGLPTDDRGESLLWTIVGVLAALALAIWILLHLTASTAR